MSKTITRTITTTEIKYKALDGTTGSYFVQGEFNDIITLTKILSKEHRSDAFVTGYRIVSALYEMPISDFVSFAAVNGDFTIIAEV